MKRKETQISQTAILEASTQFCDMIALCPDSNERINGFDLAILGSS